MSDGTVQRLCRVLTRRQQARVDLSSIDADSPGGWMGLPRTLVDMILEFLRTDRNALLSCSLTCRALFCSARRAIHERLYVAGPILFPSAERLTEWRWIFDQRYLRILSLVDDADLVQYTRHLIIGVGQIFTPRTLRPHISTFQKYVWLTSLTITRFDPTPFLPVFDRYFHHLSHSIRSIHLISPGGTPYAMVDFISRFRILDNLEFNPVVEPPLRPQNHSSSLGPRPWFTPLAGTLRIVNTDTQGTISLESLLHFPGGLRFRSLEFVCCTDISTSGIIQKCSSTLESVTFTLHCRESTCRWRFSYSRFVLVLVTLESTFLELNLEACPKLRVFEARIETSEYAFGNLINWLANVLGTVTSPVFSKFILSLHQTMLEQHVFQITPTTAGPLDRWVFHVAIQSGTRFIIKGDLPLVWRQVMVHCFPFSTSVGAIRFDFPDPDTAPRCGRGG